MKQQKLTIDLQQNVIPISAVAAQLARLIKQARATAQPIVITQKGYPSGVIVSVELFTALRELAEQEAEETDTTARLPVPQEVDLDTLFVTDVQNQHQVRIRVRSQAGVPMYLCLPYDLDGGRRYTFASAVGPEPTVTIGNGEPRRLTADDAPAFAAWCRLADADLAQD